MLNLTHLEHTCLAIAFTLVGALLGDVLVGAAFAIGVFTGREHAQREYKIGNPSKLYGYEALDFWRWKVDAQLDLISPIVAACLLGYVIK